MSNNLLLTQPDLFRPLFLRMLRSSGVVREAAELVGLTAGAVRSAMRKDSAFALLVSEAIEDSTDLLAKEAWDRAMNGSDLLLMFMLKARRPEEYREKTTVNGGPTINVKAYVGFSPDQWDQHQNELDSDSIDSTAQRLDVTGSDAETDLSLPAPRLATRSTT